MAFSAFKCAASYFEFFIANHPFVLYLVKNNMVPLFSGAVKNGKGS